ncbi:MAG TPA: type II toxin-antitoxin system RelE/ParE family toxin [Xanthomonadales bacterium]|nr:type II toxin-antitoxin system RelE/ParE family toxin [Xanthomonadales bacterium]
MSKGKVIYYTTPKGENPVKDFIESLSKKQKAKIFRIFLTLAEYGLLSILPHTKKLSGTPLWEIRILGQDNIRILYVTVERDNILVLHGFIKKKQKTPPKEIQIALMRYKETLAS